MIRIFLVLSLILGLWLWRVGTLVDEDGAYMRLLARSFDEVPYIVWLKACFSYPFEILHSDFTFPPLFPFLQWVLGSEGWGRAQGLALVSLAGAGAAWGWAIDPLLESGSERRKWILPGILLLCAGNGIWAEVRLGTAMPLALLWWVLGLGYFLRSRDVVAGALLGLAALTHFSGGFLVAALLLCQALGSTGPLISRLRRIGVLGGSFLAVTAPWWIRSVGLGHEPWFSHFTPAHLLGDAGHFHWFADTDSGTGRLTNPYGPSGAFDESARDHWEDFLRPYVGTFFATGLMAGLILGIWLIFAARRPRQRTFYVLLLLTAALLWIRQTWLGLGSARTNWLPLDVLVATWIWLVLHDRRPVLRHVGILICFGLLVSNWHGLVGAWTPGQDTSILTAETERTARALREANTDGLGIVAGRSAAHALAVHLPRVPVVILPANYGHPGLMDQFIERFKIHWTTEESVAPHLSKYRLQAHQAPDGTQVFRIMPR